MITSYSLAFTLSAINCWQIVYDSGITKIEKKRLRETNLQKKLVKIYKVNFLMVEIQSNNNGPNSVMLSISQNYILIYF